MTSPGELPPPPTGQPELSAGNEQSVQLPESRRADATPGEASTTDQPTQQQTPPPHPGGPAGGEPPPGPHVEAAPDDQQRQQQDGEAPAHPEDVGAQQQQQEPQQEQQQEQDPPQQEEQLQEQDAVTDADALARAEALKCEGNQLFGRGLWDEAAAKYNEALDAAPRSASREQAIYFANLAACNIKTQQYAVAVQNCTEAIRLDGSYQKAYMRRCEAFERLEKVDHALSDAKALLEVAPECAWARARVAALQPLVDERTEKLKAEMFGKLKELGNTVLGKFGLSVDNFKFDKDPNTGGYSIRFER
ncbi:hypothetical protein PLESTB_001000100 [Pleodorina starrii]|uniref:Uncharacterized protein n=1 Tax=Pleodorina starrii TaxID=330485 RepID=A0A9W6BNL4_9CHLO|nr:hypothetical protein PLESTM_001859100 [Pleodorina starrii]GLC55556.1 hypothetical protein PLESTB_001000100 [Pleodorina starrii]GLC76437.1 hypothetical protein PLESTF_001780400 [Pleodorina starrii]